MLLKRSIWPGYVPILASAMAIMFVRTLLAAKLLDVPEFALFSVGILVSNSFCMLGCFGFYLLLQRDLPMLIAKGRCVRGSLLLHQTLILSVVGFLGLLPLSFFGLFSVSPAFFAISLLNGFAQQAFLVVTLQSRSEGRSMRFALDNLMRSVAVLAVIAFIGWNSGTAASMLLAESLVTLAMVAWIYGAMGRQGAIGRKALWVVAARGFSSARWWSSLALMATGIFGFVMLSGDRWIAAALLDRDGFALYAFAGVVLIVAQSLQSVINVSVFPGLAKTYALFGCTSAARAALRYSLIGLIVAFCMAVPVFFMTNHAIELFYPAYAPTREFLALFLLIASLRVSDFLSSFLIIAGRERLLLGVNMLSVGLGGVVWLGFFGLDVASMRPFSIAWFAALVTAFNYAACLLVTVHSSKAVR